MEFPAPANPTHEKNIICIDTDDVLTETYEKFKRKTSFVKLLRKKAPPNGPSEAMKVLFKESELYAQELISNHIAQGKEKIIIVGMIANNMKLLKK